MIIEDQVVRAPPPRSGRGDIGAKTFGDKIRWHSVDLRRI